MILLQIFFRFPPRTTYLDLSKNEIVFIDDLPGLPDLIFLNFTEKNITDIHYDAFDRKSSILAKFHGILINDNLRLTLKSLDSLTTLVLSYNKLSSIADDMFEWNPLKLERLYLGKLLAHLFTHEDPTYHMRCRKPHERSQ